MWDTLFVRGVVPQEIVYKSCFDFEVIPKGTGRSQPLPGTKGAPIGNMACENNAQYVRSKVRDGGGATRTSTSAPSGVTTTTKTTAATTTTSAETQTMTTTRRVVTPPAPPSVASSCAAIYEQYSACLATSTSTILPTQVEQCSDVHTRCGGAFGQCCVSSSCAETHPGWWECVPYSSSTSSPTQTPESCSSLHSRCGGIMYDGPRCCEAGSTCVETHENWWECV